MKCVKCVNVAREQGWVENLPVQTVFSCSVVQRIVVQIIYYILLFSVLIQCGSKKLLFKYS